MIPATKKKLREAQFFFGCLKNESGPLDSGENFDYYLSAFLSAGRSVTDVMNHEDSKRCDEVFPRLDDGKNCAECGRNLPPTRKYPLTNDEPELFKAMKTYRVLVVHRTGDLSEDEAPAEQEIITVYGNYSEHPFHGVQITGAPPTESSGPSAIIPGPFRRSLVVGDKTYPLIEVCQRFLDILVRFVDTFYGAHTRDSR